MNAQFVQPRGAMTYWTAGDTQRHDLAQVLHKLDLEDFMPPARSDADTLRAAIRDYCKAISSGPEEFSPKRDRMVQRLKAIVMGTAPWGWRRSGARGGSRPDDGDGETLAAAGNWTEPRLVKDLAGLARVVTCRRKTAE